MLHPIGAPQPGGPVAHTWAEVCAATGATPHALMQWESIRRDWSGGEPDTGDTGPDLLARLLHVLRPVTPDECTLAIWDGYGWFNSGWELVVDEKQGVVVGRRPLPAAHDHATRAAPRLRLPHRDYSLFAGPLAAVPLFGEISPGGHHIAHSPNLMWPADRSWFLGSESTSTRP